MRFAFPMPAYHMHSRSGACGFPLVLLQAIQGTQFWRTVGVMSANNGCARDVALRVFLCSTGILVSGSSPTRVISTAAERLPRGLYKSGEGRRSVSSP